MTAENSMKAQRDRLLAFSFASADLFLEISGDGTIHHALGAAKAITGIDDKELTGQDWLSVFAEENHDRLKAMRKAAKPGLRKGPIVVRMCPDKYKNKRAVVTAITLPDSDYFYVTLGVSNHIMAKISDALEDYENAEVLTSENFADAAKEAMKQAKEMGQNVDMTLLDIGSNEKDKERLGSEVWGKLSDSIGQLLLAQSIDGRTAAEVGDGKYSVLHGANINSDELKRQISDLAKEQDPDGQGLDVASKTVTADLDTMTEKDMARALVYTIHEFERKGTDLSIENLNNGFQAYVAANAQKMKEFKDFIERLTFSLHFQPIVRLDNYELSHYEMLCRFDHGNTQEWIMFGEDIGMAAEFDLAVCERAINYLNFQGGRRHKFSVNISGQSIENPEFFEKLLGKLKAAPGAHQNIMFEITESSQIEDLSVVNSFVTHLRDKGYKVALDDFGAGAASFQYLQGLNVDYVKIDGKYIRDLPSSQRNVALVKNLAQLCKDLNIAVIAEYVEEQEHIDILKDMGVEYGQGYYFGKPEPKPSYKQLKKPA